MEGFFVKATIMPRLRRRFLLSKVADVFKGSLMWLFPVVVAVTSADDLLKTYHLSEVTLDLDITPAYIDAFVVPPGKRWTVYGWQKSVTTGNTIMQLRDSTSGIVLLLIPSGSTQVLAHDKNLPMPEGWAIQMYGTDDIGDIARKFQLYYSEEDAY